MMSGMNEYSGKMTECDHRLPINNASRVLVSVVAVK